MFSYILAVFFIPILGEVLFMQTFYTPTQVANLLKVKKNYVLEQIHRGELKAYRLSEKRFRISAEALNEFLDKHKVKD